FLSLRRQPAQLDHHREVHQDDRHGDDRRATCGTVVSKGKHRPGKDQEGIFCSLTSSATGSGMPLILPSTTIDSRTNAWKRQTMIAPGRTLVCWQTTT